jgi:hypothetical protein
MHAKGMGDVMRNLFWPKSRNPNPNGFTRFGRVLHWLGAMIGVPLFALSVFWMGVAIIDALTNAGEWSAYAAGVFNPKWPSSGGLALIALIPAIVIYFLGRALRYIFSGE